MVGYYYRVVLCRLFSCYALHQRAYNSINKWGFVTFASVQSPFDELKKVPISMQLSLLAENNSSKKTLEKSIGKKDM